jgi:PAS domain S-box-containing protein
MLGMTEGITSRKQTEMALGQSREQYYALLQSIDGIVWELDCETWRFTFVSKQAERLLGYPVVRWLDEPSFWTDHLHVEDRAQTVEKRRNLGERNENGELEYRMVQADGRIVWFRDSVTVEQRDRPTFRLRGVMFDITELKQEEALRAGENKILEMIATSAPIIGILNEIVLLIESHSPGMRCGVLLLGEDGIHVSRAVGPNLPESYKEAVKGRAIGPYEGSCGAAMYYKTPIVVADVRTDPRWEKYRDLALTHALKACWSTPILTPQGTVLGTFGMHYGEARSPNVAEERLAEVATRLASIAMERELAEASLRQSEERYRALVTATAQDVWRTDPGGKEFVTFALEKMKGRDTKVSDDGWLSAIHPDDRQRYLKDWTHAIKTMSLFESEFRVKTDSGSYRTFQSRGVPIKQRNGSVREWVGSNVDITERKQTEAALRESEERSRATLQAIPDLMFLLAEDGSYLACHAKSADELLLPPEQLLKRNMRDVVPAEIANAFQQAFYKASESDEPQTIEYDLVVHGRLRHTEARVVRSGKGRFLALVRDVTTRKLAEAALRESEERFRLVALATRDAIYDWDIRQNAFWRNESFQRLYSPDCPTTLDYEWWRDRIHPHDQARVARGVEDAFREQRQLWSDEYLFRRGDGNYATVMDRGYILYDSNGEAVRMIGAMTDITAHRESEKALRASEERYRNVVETQTEMICRFLPDTTLTFVNEAYCRHFGKTRGELIGKSFLNLIPEADQPRVREILISISERRYSGPIEHETIQPDGSTRWTQWCNRALRDGNGDVELQGIGRDITGQKRAQEALRESREELQRSHAQIRQLAGCLMKAQEEERRHIARELHDDLNQQIAGLSIALSSIKRQLPPSADVVARRLGEVQEHASRIADGIRSLSHHLHPVALEHAGLVGALRSLATEFSSSQAVKVDLHTPESLNPVPNDIAICIYRIAQESLQNVSKHSGAGHVNVDLSVHENCINLLITDDGCGFEMENARKKGGLGLISMAERVSLLQGVFEVRTRPGYGTCLRVIVPLTIDQT